ncbi:MAG: hypothetical protein WCI89_02305 [bacterium]
MYLLEYCPSGASYCTIVGALVNNIINPALLLLSGVALLIFSWGIVQFLISLNKGEKGTGEGKQHMLWGMVGMFILLFAFAIFNVLVKTVASLG